MNKKILGIDLNKIVKDRRIDGNKIYNIKIEELNVDEEANRIILELRERNVHALYSPVNKNSRKLFKSLGASEFMDILPKPTVGISYANQANLLRVLDDYEIVLRTEFFTEMIEERHKESIWIARNGDFDSGASIDLDKSSIDNFINRVKRWIVLNEDFIRSKDDEYIRNKLLNKTLNDILD